MLLVYSTALADWINSRRGSFTHLQRCSRRILQPQPPGSIHVGGVLPICRDAVGVFYSPANWINSRRGSFTFLQRCCWCILQPQPPWSIHVGGVLPFCRDAVGVFYSPNRLDQFTSGEFYPSAEMQSAYFTAPANWINSRRGSFTLLQRCSRRILQPQPPGSIHVGGVLPFCRDQSVYSTTPADWLNSRRGSFTPLKRCNRCILQTKPTVLVNWHRVNFAFKRLGNSVHCITL